MAWREDVNFGKLSAELPILPPTHTVANVPAAANYAGGVIYVSNGAAGSPILAFSDGTNWLRSDTAAAIAAE